MKFNVYEMINGAGKIPNLKIIIPYEKSISDVNRKTIPIWNHVRLIKTMDLKETIDNYNIGELLLDIEDIGYHVIQKEKPKFNLESDIDNIISNINKLGTDVKKAGLDMYNLEICKHES